ncbi:MAG: Chromosome partition protein Smc [Chroococcopsis gigantea SAG 12.99]|jgi:uncharacterized protein (DUF3084 family)|nr:Chromosome partition protein Smc [Chroococcopsis gigantea SAG 12.99]
MTSAYILIVAMILLGGLLATIGDRLGSKIGKKRMRLFNLRPRQTATVVTIVTGALIAGSTLTLLFASSKSLRQGVFDLDRILNERREAIKQLESDLDTARAEKKNIEKALKTTKKEQIDVQKRLDQLKESFASSRQQLSKVSGQLVAVRSDVKSLESEREQLVQQKNQLTAQRDRLSVQKNQLNAQRLQLSGQVGQLKAEVQLRDNQLIKREGQLKQQTLALQELQTEQKNLQEEINKRDSHIVTLDKSIAEKDGALQQREQKLKELETQTSFLRKEVEVLEQYYQTYQELREKQIAIVKGQVLSFGAFKIVDPQAVVSVIDRLLQEANMYAIRATQPKNANSQDRVVKITKAQVEQLIEQLKDGKEYVVRILSAGNYVLGESEVRVFADVVSNQKIFEQKQQIAAVSIDSQNMTEDDIQKRLDLLLAASQFRARRAGILGAIQVEDGRLTTLVNFIDRVKQSNGSVDEIQAIASKPAYTAGPLIIRLVAIRNGEITFSTS